MEIDGIELAAASGTVNDFPTDPSISWELTGSGCFLHNGVFGIEPGATVVISFEVHGSDCSLGESPKFRVHPFGRADYGPLAHGDLLKVQNQNEEASENAHFTLALLISNGSETAWIHDPTVQFEPPDPSGPFESRDDA
jgi:hypothetical protein